MDGEHCPKCGKYLSFIRGFKSEEFGLTKVIGKCKTHGDVDITNTTDLDYDDFEEPMQT